MRGVWLVHGGAVEAEATRSREGAIGRAKEHCQASGFGYEEVWVHDPDDPKKDERIGVTDGKRKLKHPACIHVRWVPIREI